MDINAHDYSMIRKGLNYPIRTLGQKPTLGQGGGALLVEKVCVFWLGLVVLVVGHVGVVVGVELEQLRVDRLGRALELDVRAAWKGRADKGHAAVPVARIIM